MDSGDQKSRVVSACYPVKMGEMSIDFAGLVIIIRFDSFPRIISLIGRQWRRERMNALSGLFSLSCFDVSVGKRRKNRENN